MQTLITLLDRVGEHLSNPWFWLTAHLEGHQLDASQINAQLWTGAGIQTASDVAQLLADGITADIDMREEFDDRPLLASQQLRYLWVPQTDNGQPKPVSDYQQIWEFAKPLLQAGGVVYAHCAAGHNRGPSAAYFLLRAHWGVDPASALALIKLLRPVATLAYAADADRAITALGLDPKRGRAA